MRPRVPLQGPPGREMDTSHASLPVPITLQVRSSPRACARVYPSRVHQGVLWVWPDYSPAAIQEAAAATPPPFVPELDDPTFVGKEGGPRFSVHELEYG